MPLLLKKEENNNTILFWEISEPLENLISLASNIDCSHLKSDKRKKEFLACRILLNHFDKNLKISYSENGSPNLNNHQYISISHSGNLVCIIISNKKIGIDIEMISDKYKFEEIHMISAKNNDGIDNLLSTIEAQLPENNHLYDENFNLQDKNDSFMFSELIREKIIRKLGDELPHDTFVEIDLVKDKKDITEIHATIYITRKSQKQIVIGSQGEVLKEIGKQARLEIEKYLGKKVFLKTWVKVKKNWNTDSGFIQSLGVGGNYESK